MKHLLSKVSIFLFAALLLSSCAGVKMPSSYTVTPSPLTLEGNKVNVDIQADFAAKSFNKKATVNFTPTLQYNGKEIALKTVTYKGEKAAGKGQPVPYNNASTLKYTDSFTFEDGMENSELTVKPVIKKGNKELKSEEVKLADGVVTTYTDISHNENVIFADINTAAQYGMDTKEYYETKTIISESLTAYFEVNLYKLNYNLRLNKVNSLKLQERRVKDFINKGWKIEKIEIKAYASPEGEERFNEGLSENRSIVGKKIINGIFKELCEEFKSKVQEKNPEGIYTYDVQALGEDWNGFIDAVSASDINDKDVILNVVRSQATPAQKEQEIRNMTLIYDELIYEVLPPLRRVEVTVYCYEPKKSAEELLEKALNDPSSLFNKELLYAGTLTDNLDEKVAIYTSYAQLFPHDWKGNVNAGAALLLNGDAKAAKAYLEKANSQSPNNPIVLNNMGVRALMAGEYETALSNFQKAQQVGVNVDYNTSLLNLINGDYSKAATSLEEETCNYNTALVQMAQGNLNKAKSTLACAPESAQTFYLLAVVNARLQESNSVMTNLRKAVALNNDLKTKAANDIEFIGYRENAEFIEIIK